MIGEDSGGLCQNPFCKKASSSDSEYFNGKVKSSERWKLLKLLTDGMEVSTNFNLCLTFYPNTLSGNDSGLIFYILI